MSRSCMRENIHHFQMSGYFCDVTLRGSGAGQRSIKAHRLILAASSEYFKAMFTHGMAESYAEEIVIELVPHDILNQIVDFCYTGAVTVEKYNMEQLLYTSNFLGVSCIEFQCSRYLHEHLNPSNVWDALCLAQELSNSMLDRSATIYVLANFDECYKTEGFCNLCIDQLRQLLSNEGLTVKREEQVYEAILRWVRYEAASRQKHLPSLLQHVRGELMERMFIFRQVAREELIIKNSDSRKFLYHALEYHLSQNNDMTTSSNLTSPLRHHSNNINKSGRVRDCVVGRIFIIGGRDGHGVQDSVKTFNLDNLNNKKKNRNQYSTTQKYNSMSVGRSHAAVVHVQGDGFIYCIGGVGTQGEDLNSVVKYDVINNRWTNENSLNNCQGILQAVLSHREIYVMGGSTVDGRALDSIEKLSLDAGQQHWTDLTEMPLKRRNFAAVRSGDYIYTIAGHDSSKVTGNCQMYHTRTCKWSLMASLNKPRMDHAAVITDHGKTFVYGGENESGFLLDCIEKYNETLQMWLTVKHTHTPTTGASLIFNRERVDDGTVSDTLYILGGAKGNGVFVDKVMRLRLNSIDYDIVEKDGIGDIQFTGTCLVT